MGRKPGKCPFGRLRRSQLLPCQMGSLSEGHPASRSKWVSGSLCSRFLPGHLASARGPKPPSLMVKLSNILHATVDTSAGRIMYPCRPGAPTLINYSHTCTLEAEITTHTRYQHIHVPYRSRTRRCAMLGKCFLSHSHPTPYFSLFLGSEPSSLCRYLCLMQNNL